MDKKEIEVYSSIVARIEERAKDEIEHQLKYERNEDVRNKINKAMLDLFGCIMDEVKTFSEFLVEYNTKEKVNEKN